MGRKGKNRAVLPDGKAKYEQLPMQAKKRDRMSLFFVCRENVLEKAVRQKYNEDDRAGDNADDRM